jgi:hypothetical protein
MNQFTDSFSHYGTSQLLKKWNFPRGWSGGWTIGSSFALGAAAQGLQIDNVDLAFPVPTYSHYIFGIRMKLVSTSTGAFGDVVKFLSSNGTIIASISCDSTFHWFLRRGGTTLATATSTVSLGTSFYLEVDYFQNATTGTFTVYVNNVSFVTFTGNTGSTAISAIAIGEATQFKRIQFSDCYCNDDLGSVANARFGPCTVAPFAMASAGSHTDFSRVGAASNVAAINKTLADVASYVTDNIIGHRDSYTPAAASGTVKGARLWDYINVKGTGSRGLALTTESGAVDDIGVTQVLTPNTDQFITKDLSVDPNTSALVTLTNLNAMKHGQKIIS